MAVKFYQFYLFDDVPLILEDLSGVEYTVDPQGSGHFHTCNMSTALLYAISEFEADACIVEALWNTKKYACKVIISSEIVVKN